MMKVSVQQARDELEDLLRRVNQGQELVIIGADGSAFKLTALPRTPQPIFGSAHGLVSIEPDFDTPIDGFDEYMP